MIFVNLPTMTTRNQSARDSPLGRQNRGKRREVAATPGVPQLIFMGIAPKKSRLPMSTPQWRRIA
jgi:hypothetical protein